MKEPEMYVTILHKDNAAPFAPYLLPQVGRALGAGEDIAGLGAIKDGHAVGALAFRVDDGVLRILSLYVDTAARRQGVGTVLLEALAEVIEAMDEEIEDVQTDYLTDTADEEAAAAFLDDAGFEVLRVTERFFSVDTEKLHEQPLLKEAFTGNFTADAHVRPFSALTPEQLRELEADETVPFKLKPSAMENSPLRQGSVAWVEDSRVLAWLLCYQGFDGEIVLSAACKRDGAPTQSFVRLVQAFANRCYMILGHDYTVYISAIDDYAASLVKKLADGTQKEYKQVVARIDRTALRSRRLEEDDED